MVSQLLANSKLLFLFKEGLHNVILIASLTRYLNILFKLQQELQSASCQFFLKGSLGQVFSHCECKTVVWRWPNREEGRTRAICIPLQAQVSRIITPAEFHEKNYRLPVIYMNFCFARIHQMLYELAMFINRLLLFNLSTRFRNTALFCSEEEVLNLIQVLDVFCNCYSCHLQPHFFILCITYIYLAITLVNMVKNTHKVYTLYVKLIL